MADTPSTAAPISPARSGTAVFDAMFKLSGVVMASPKDLAARLGRGLSPQDPSPEREYLTFVAERCATLDADPQFGHGQMMTGHHLNGVAAMDADAAVREIAQGMGPNVEPAAVVRLLTLEGDGDQAARDWLTDVVIGHHKDGRMTEVYEYQEHDFDVYVRPQDGWWLVPGMPAAARYLGLAESKAEAHRVALERGATSLLYKGVSSMANDAARHVTPKLASAADRTFFHAFARHRSDKEKWAALKTARILHALGNKLEAEGHHPEAVPSDTALLRAVNAVVSPRDDRVDANLVELAFTVTAIAGSAKPGEHHWMMLDRYRHPMNGMAPRGIDMGRVWRQAHDAQRRDAERFIGSTATDLTR